MDFRRVNLLNAFLLKIASLRIPKFGHSKKRWYLCIVFATEIETPKNINH